MCKYLLYILMGLYIQQTMSLSKQELAVNKLIIPWMQEHNIPGVAIALYVHGQSYLLHYGYADDTQQKSVTQKTVFEIGSVSKIFTCLLVAQEVIAGRMRLSDPITTYLPMLSSNTRLTTITLEKLATHTATMPYDVPASINSKNAFLSYMRTWKPTHPNELWFQYSNPGVELLRLALEELEHDSINNIFIHKILNPLKMSPISINVPTKHMPEYACSYTKKGENARPWDDGILMGSGALRATSADMLIFLKAALRLPGTPPTIKQAMELTQRPYITVSTMRHGLGWEIRDLNQLKNKDPIFWGFTAQKVADPAKALTTPALFEKTGTTRGFHAYIGVIPSQDAGIVIMMNRTLSNGWNTIQKMGRKILFALKD